ncbi:MAG: GNAT family N-acetyltransferase [Proteobacteria bacterium]|nr:GNAT family N-acetyltransferase [Pseudomonadota bacterium]
MALMYRQCSSSSIEAHCSLFRTVFPPSANHDPAYLRWLYCENPDGEVVGFDAWTEEGELAATYVCVPASLRLRGQSVRGLLSLNTATHPRFRGAGLFTTLANATYELAKERGYTVVYGVANANSTPGFGGKLRFQIVAPLKAEIGVSAPSITRPERIAECSFYRTWNSKTLMWRSSNPSNPLVMTIANGLVRLAGETQKPGIRVEANILMDDGARHDAFEKAGSVQHSLRFAPLRLSLGLFPNGCRSAGLSLPIPDALKPSPLNLIYRNLDDPADQLTPEDVFISFVDFDAY